MCLELITLAHSVLHVQEIYLRWSNDNTADASISEPRYLHNMNALTFEI
jgi:hypothetical protein